MHILQKNVVMVANTVARWYIHNALLYVKLFVAARALFLVTMCVIKFTTVLLLTFHIALFYTVALSLVAGIRVLQVAMCKPVQ